MMIRNPVPQKFIPYSLIMQHVPTPQRQMEPPKNDRIEGNQGLIDPLGGLGIATGALALGILVQVFFGEVHEY